MTGTAGVRLSSTLSESQRNACQPPPQLQARKTILAAPLSPFTSNILFYVMSCDIFHISHVFNMF